jgi:hypothetical protein
MSFWQWLDKRQFSFWHVAIGAVLARLMERILGI